MRRLSPKFINRLIVGLLLLAPLVYLFGVLIASLIGAHGSFDVSTDLSTLLSQFFTSGNFVHGIGLDCLSNNPSGFVPVADLIKYIDVNMLHFGTNGVAVGVMAYGYFYWCFHVLLFDLAFFGVSFIIRIFKKTLSMLEGDR